MNHEDWQDIETEGGSDGAPGESDEREIQELLDLGYEQLDGFVTWLEERQGIGTRAAQQDCFNAEALLDYLANHHRKSVSEVNEFELRWFIFSHYIRKSMAEPETEQRLIESLARFFDFLHAEHAELVPAWLPAVLSDDAYYHSRWTAYHELSQTDEEAWEYGFRLWCEDLEDALDARALWLPRDLGNGEVWGNVMGLFEASLYEEANRNWQTQREEMLASGMETEGVRDRLTADYYAWLESPLPHLDDETPRERIFRERLESGTELEDDDL
jgi:hypothetical protein